MVTIALRSQLRSRIDSSNGDSKCLIWDSIRAGEKNNHMFHALLSWVMLTSKIVGRTGKVYAVDSAVQVKNAVDRAESERRRASSSPPTTPEERRRQGALCSAARQLKMAGNVEVIHADVLEW